MLSREATKHPLPNAVTNLFSLLPSDPLRSWHTLQGCSRSGVRGHSRAGLTTRISKHRVGVIGFSFCVSSAITRIRESLAGDLLKLDRESSKSSWELRSRREPAPARKPARARLRRITSTCSASKSSRSTDSSSLNPLMRSCCSELMKGSGTKASVQQGPPSWRSQSKHSPAAPKTTSRSPQTPPASRARSRCQCPKYRTSSKSPAQGQHRRTQDPSEVERQTKGCGALTPKSHQQWPRTLLHSSA